jgi:hypothetical protein
MDAAWTNFFRYNALFLWPDLYIPDYRTLSSENQLATVILMPEALCNPWKWKGTRYFLGLRSPSSILRSHDFISWRKAIKMRLPLYFFFKILFLDLFRFSAGRIEILVCHWWALQSEHISIQSQEKSYEWSRPKWRFAARERECISVKELIVSTDILFNKFIECSDHGVGEMRTIRPSVVRAIIAWDCRLARADNREISI